eukprot:12918239-Prorocentrum_lima.AAC.1
MYGAWGTDFYGPGFIKSPTKWMTNSPDIAQSLSTKCDKTHRHCIAGRNSKVLSAKERYPVKFVAAVLRALRRHL